MSKLGIPPSILDTDLYKLTMQQAVLRHFPDCQASYRFTNRDKHIQFSRACYEAFTFAVSQFGTIALTQSERSWLAQTCPFLEPEYLDYLESYRFKPEQVDIQFVLSEGGESPDPKSQKGQIEITANGPWEETIFWETPLMACLSEVYFAIDDTDWTYDGQEESAYQKGKALIEAGCIFNEFGARRRRSFRNQDIVVQALVKASKDLTGPGKLLGTSNVHLARLYGINPTGTVAHEWYMGIGALKGYENVHDIALDLWEQVYYSKTILLALTDTFSTQAFFQTFSKSPERARRWDGLRQDSGDPFVYAERAKEVYQSMGIDHTQKLIIYSDALTIDKALALKELTDKIGFKSSFGIGTSLTNDFTKASSNGTEKSKALNMVIKLASAGGKPCVKISDDISKNTGDEATAEHIKKIFGLNET